MKKLLALCLTVMLVVAMVPAFAVSADATPTITVSDAEGFIGDTVDVKIALANNPGIMSAKIKVAYDANVLELTARTAGSDYAANMSFSKTLDVNPYIVNFVDSINPDVTASDFVTLTFKIKDGAAVGKTAIEVTYKQADVCNTAWEDVVFAIDNGEVTVKCAHKNTSTIPAVDATCTATGLTAGTVCDDCGETIKAQETVDKIAHNEVVEGAVDADCENAGSTGTTKCSVCGETIKAAEVIDALGHKEEIVGAKEATCEAPGYTGDKVCSVCGKELEKGTEIPQLAHNWVAVEKVDATCAAEGMEAHYACDAGCGKLAADEAGAEEVAAADLVIAKLAHTIAKVEGVAATEEKTGIKEHFACSECDALFADAEGTTAIDADDVVIPVIEKAPENADQGDKAPATNDLVNMFAVVAMLIAAAVTSVVVLKKKA